MKKILFMCVANSARSQMAEALAKSLWKEQVHVESAGSVPSGKVNPLVAEALKPLNISMKEHFSKATHELPEAFIKGLDYVITLCAEEACPLSPSASAEKLAWTYPDPENLQDFEKIREDLIQKLKELPV